MAGKNGFLTPTEFARLIGVTSNVVRYAIGKGRLKVKTINGTKLIEPEAGKQEWFENIDHVASAKGKKPKAKKPGAKLEPYQAATYQGLTTSDAERREKVYKSKLSELKYLEQAGELVKVKDVEREAFECGRQTRDSVMSIPARFSHEFAVITNPHELEIRLTKELAKALEHSTGKK